MGYNTLISKSLMLALKVVKDLAEDVVVTTRTDSDFNFATPASQTITSSQLTVKMVELREKRKEDSSVKSQKSVLLYSPLIADVGASDRIAWNGEVWIIRNIVESSRKVISADIERLS